MDYFERHPSVFKKDESAKTIKMFNSVAATLVRFEVVYVKVWKEQLDHVRSGKYLLIRSYLR